MKAYHDQHFLIDPHAIQRIADLEEVKGKRVLEIGPGNGALTRALLDRGAIVHAIELDSILCEQLADTFSVKLPMDSSRYSRVMRPGADLPRSR